MKLYHGTSSVFLKEIRKSGLKSPYLTNARELAKYYAEATCDEEGGKAIIFEVTVGEENLWVDERSLEEPVGFGTKTFDQLKERIDIFLNGLEKFDSSNYRISLDTTHTCACKKIIEYSEISVCKELSSSLDTCLPNR